MHVLNLKTILVIIMIINIIVTSLTIIFAETTTNSTTTTTTTTSTSSQNMIDPEFYNTLIVLSPVLFFIGLCLRFIEAFKEALNWG